MKERSKTRYAILGILTIESMNGYEIKKMIDSSIAHFWNESFGQLYPTLKKLEQEGLIISEANNDSKNSSIYSITNHGRDVLKNWLSLPSENEIMRIEPLLKIFFGYNNSKEVTINHIKNLKKEYLTKIAVLSSIVLELENMKKPGNAHLYPLLTAKYGITAYEASVKWADEALDILNSQI